MTAIYDKHAPVKERAISINPQKKFVSSNTKNLMKERDNLYKQHKSKPSITLKLKLNDCKKRVQYAIRADTKCEMNQQIEKDGFWRGLDKVYSLKSKK